jgi:hypothetical protein
MTVTQTLTTVRDEDHFSTTLPPPLQLGITVTTSLCITAAPCRQPTILSNGLRMGLFLFVGLLKNGRYKEVSEYTCENINMLTNRTVD